MIGEEARNPTLMPTFLGYPVSWKPALFFWKGKRTDGGRPPTGHPCLQDAYPAADGSFSPVFTRGGICRKDTNITEFDYVVLVKRDGVEVDGDLIYDKDKIRVYKVN